MSVSGAENRASLPNIPSVDGLGGQHPESRPSSASQRNRKYTTTACESCRHRRVKCDGQKPACAQCAKTLRQCVYSSRDRRTLQARQQDAENLNNKIRALEDLITRLQSGTEAEAVTALHLLRADRQALQTLTEANTTRQAHTSTQHNYGRAELPDGLTGYTAGNLQKGSPGTSSSTSTDEQRSHKLSLYPTALSDSGHDTSRFVELDGDMEMDTGERPRALNNQHAIRSERNINAPRTRAFSHRLLVSTYNKADISHQAYHQSLPAQEYTKPPTVRASQRQAHVNTGGGDTRTNTSPPTSMEVTTLYHNQYSSIPPTTIVNTFGNLGLVNSIFANNFPRDLQERQALVLTKPAWTTPTMTFFDDSPLAQLIENFRQVSLNHIAEGKPAAEIIGTYDTVDVELLFRGRNPTDSLDDMDVGNFACDIWKNVLGEQDTFVVLAMVSMNARLARWMLIPCVETWNQLPEMARPFPSQKILPHNPTIDFCAHPFARQSLMNNYSDWISAGRLGKTSVSWPYGFDEAVRHDPKTGRRKTTRLFEKHIADPVNWTWARDVLEIMPCMEDLGAVIRQG